MKFWDTIAKMCGVKVDASRWGERPIAMTIGREFGGAAGPLGRAYERVDEIVGKVRGHAFKVEMRDHSLAATIDGCGFRIIEAEKAVAINGDTRIGLIAIERIRPMTAGEVGLKQAAEMLHRAAKAMNPDAPVVLS